MSQPLRPVPYVDLSRYMGDWRVIQVIPYFAERHAFDSIESYALLPDGRIDNIFRFRKHGFDAPQKTFHFTAEVVNKKTNAEWRVRFLPFLKVAYVVIDLDPDYQWVVVGHPSRRYGWIMAREKSIAPGVLRGIHERLRAQGYDPAKFANVPQIPPA
jgi:apolipoprotein D and lipocalin family protein